MQSSSGGPPQVDVAKPAEHCHPMRTVAAVLALAWWQAIGCEQSEGGQCVKAEDCATGLACGPKNTCATPKTIACQQGRTCAVGASVRPRTACALQLPRGLQVVGKLQALRLVHGKGRQVCTATNEDCKQSGTARTAANAGKDGLCVTPATRTASERAAARTAAVARPRRLVRCHP